jgi:1,4-alpha-glucan branching enzyme
MSRLGSLIIFLCFSGYLSGQIIITSPVLPVDNQPVNITFDAAQGNKGLVSFTGDVYAYTGVITDKSTSNTNWLYVKEKSWTDNPASCKMTRIDATHYSLSITPSIREFYGVPEGEKIKKMAFVFHCPCPPTGEPSGRGVGGADILVDVFEPVLNVSIAKPSDYFNLVQVNQTFDVLVNASNNDSICLFLDNTKVLSSSGQTLSYTLTTKVDKHMLVATAYKGTQTNSDTAYYLVKGTTQNIPVPAGMHDGVNYPDNQSATFVLFAPHKNSVLLLGDFNNWSPDNAFLMNKDGDHFWLNITGLTSNKEYVFQYLIDDTIRIADPYSEKILDPGNDKSITSRIYPDLISYPTGKTTEIAGVIQPGQTAYNWQMPEFVLPPKEKLVVYELLIRDFTANRDIKTITDTLSYLKRLGVNAIELMPFNEFEGNDSWGYNPSFLFAPDKAYGTKNDYKKFVDECHLNGIAVIQDLVLNHSYGQSPLVRMYFSDGNPSVENPWFNQVSNIRNPGLQFGFDFNHESMYTRKLVDSVASFWINEYKIDGFRYDFTKGFSNTPYEVNDWANEYDFARIFNLERMASAVWKRKPTAYIIFEHFADNTEETKLANFGAMLWGNLNYAYNQGTMGYNDGWDFSWISYKNRAWDNPNVMGYMESHDEQRLMFKNLTYGNSIGSYNVKNLTTALKRMELANNFFFTIPGPKMIWQFGELGYDISIDSAGRTGMKPIHWDYYNNTSRKHLYEVSKALIKLKSEEPVFSTKNFTVNASGSVKEIDLNDTITKVVIVGNFDLTDKAYTINFPLVGAWYEFYTGDSISLINTNYAAVLKAGEYRLYSNKKLKGFASVPSRINMALLNSKIKVFPNPFTTDIFIENGGNINAFEISNSQGQVIISRQGSNINHVNVAELSPGLYFLILHFSNGEKVVLKLVKI